MTKIPTIMQYLVTLVANSRLNAAYATKDAATITKAEKQYKDLSEDEVTFTKPFSSVLTGGKWQTTMTCVKRGWQIQKLTYNTGTLKALTASVLQGIAHKETLGLATLPGVFYVEETGNIHLLVEKDSNVFDALKRTGYEFPTDSFKTVMYDTRDVEAFTDGYVDIDHSVVAGRFMLSYIQRKPVQEPAPQVGVQTLSVSKEEGPLAQEAAKITEGEQTLNTETSKVEEPAQEEEITEENTTPEEPVVETKPTNTKNSKK